MLAPLSWLKDYVDIKSTPDKLSDRLTEVGLGTEKVNKTENDVIFDFEITPNRPDLLSIIGIAREIAAVEETKINLPKLKDLNKEKPAKILPIDIKTNFDINPRFTAIIVSGITISDSPKWLKEKLEKMGQRSINNIVDIANFVMLETGNPLHAFDYDKIEGHTMTVEKAKGGEVFKSVDGLEYRLPKDAVIIKDGKKIIDLCGIKGGENSGITKDTTTILIRVPVEIPSLIRRASQSLSLRSEASSIFERAVDTGGTVNALSRCISLVQELAGGEIASELLDFKKDDFKPWVLDLRVERLNQILGIEINQKIVIDILERLNLTPSIKIKKQEKVIECIVPTYRNDLKIEEDLIEEVARIYGYNNFPKTLPTGEIPTTKIPYYKDYRIDEYVKNYFIGSGFSEVYTYSLLSEKDLESGRIDSEEVLRVDTPISKEYEYLRPNLKINLVKALRQNKANFAQISLFEIGKVYLGKRIDKATEAYHLAGITNKDNFFEVKGILQTLFNNLGIETDVTDLIAREEDYIFFETDYDDLIKRATFTKKFIPIPKYPPIIEDLSVVCKDVAVGKLIKEIRDQSSLIVEVSLLEKYKDTKTFHILYQDPQKNLTNQEVSKIREKIVASLKQKFKASISD